MADERAAYEMRPKDKHQKQFIAVVRAVIDGKPRDLHNGPRACSRSSAGGRDVFLLVLRPFCSGETW
jgi:hypothetical protein